MFYNFKKAMTLEEVAKVCNGSFVYPREKKKFVIGISDIETADDNFIVIAVTNEDFVELASSKAVACFVTQNDKRRIPSWISPIIVSEPLEAAKTLYEAVLRREQKPDFLSGS